MILSLSCSGPMGLSAIMAVVFCTSHAAADVRSVQSGLWSDPATWDTGQHPTGSDPVVISAGDTVIYDLASVKVAGITVEGGATLAFHPDRDGTLETDKNVLFRGKLEMRPRAPNNGGRRNSVGDWGQYFVHTLRFVDVDERDFLGGGMDLVASDVGLWVMNHGVLDIAGAQKTGWTRLAGGARAGDTSIMLEAAPTGWRIGDVISIVPTEHPKAGSVSYTGFDVRKIGGVDGARVVFEDPLDHDHPDVVDPHTGNVYTAEVLNLSRNVRIEGSGGGSASFQRSSNGRAHILIRSDVPQSVRFAELVQLGPRRPSGKYTDGVPGRYPLHFHHSRDGSRGSLVEGVVVRRSGNRAFVPHASNGITFRDTVAYDVWDDAYWWDPTKSKDPADPNASHNVLYDRAVAALVKNDPSFRGFGLTGFKLEAGSGNECRDCVAVGVQGNTSASGFHWPSTANQRPNVWIFEHGNVAHNNKVNGVYVWQNDKNPHRIFDFTAYHNGRFGVDHGAYGNQYNWFDSRLFGNAVAGWSQHSGTQGPGTPQFKSQRDDGYSFALEDVYSAEAIQFTQHAGGSNVPAFYLRCTFSEIIIHDNKRGRGKNPTWADFVECTKPDGSALTPADVRPVTVYPGMQLRFQYPDCTAEQIDHALKVSAIPPFYECGSDPLSTRPLR